MISAELNVRILFLNADGGMDIDPLTSQIWLAPPILEKANLARSPERGNQQRPVQQRMNRWLGLHLSYMLFNAQKSATTSRAGGMRKAPGRGRGLALLVVADFCKEFWLCHAFIRIVLIRFNFFVAFVDQHRI